MSTLPLPTGDFSTLTPAEKRRVIAADIIDRLDAKQLIPKTGNWVNIPKLLEGPYGTPLPTYDLQKLLAEKVPCEACALGGAICGLAHFENAIQIPDKPSKLTGGYGLTLAPDRQGKYDTTLLDRLTEIFGTQQLLFIEQCFEPRNPALQTLLTDIAGENDDDVEFLADKLCEVADDFTFHYSGNIVDAEYRFRTVWTAIRDDPEGILRVGAIEAATYGSGIYEG